MLAVLCALAVACGDSSADPPDALPDVWDAAPDVRDVGLDAADSSTPPDIAVQLAAVPGLTVVERSSPHGNYRFFELWLEQPVDHDQAGGQTFSQYMTLLHRSTTAPMTLVTGGYWNYWQSYLLEPSQLFDTNQLVVEHRYFGQSRPVPTDWQHLTVAQAAADHHRIFEALKPLYPAHWVATGASKGGMTAVYYRRHFPDDMDGTLAYVAPLSTGAPDARYIGFVDSAGTPACRAALQSAQIRMLERRTELLVYAADDAASLGYTFTRIGGLERALESLVIALPFCFWQYAGIDHCPLVPTAATGDAQLWHFLDDYVGLDWATDENLATFGPYYYQARFELGYPDVASHWLQPLMVTDATNLEAGLVPVGAPDPSFDASVMADIDAWVQTEGTELMFVYGQWDPWTAGAFTLGGATDSYFFMVAEGTHGADIAALPPAEYSVAVNALTAWYGLAPSPPPRRGPPSGSWQRYPRAPRSRLGP